MKCAKPFSTKQSEEIKSGGDKMGELKLECPNCHYVIGTSISMDIESFKSSSLSKNKSKCPNCGSMVTWDKENVRDL